jgi:TnpA family transposase
MGDIVEKRSQVKQLAGDNYQLEEDNEELRQSALDGVEIAKNVQNLMNERESLSVDLADKSVMIKKLLEQNKELSAQLDRAKMEASKMMSKKGFASSGGNNFMSPQHN